MQHGCYKVAHEADSSQVLAIAILMVFGLGLGKLWWVSRRNKKQVAVDEEKRLRIQEMRKSGQLVETKKINDIPFGIRALESGVEIDGIWVSKSNIPIPESLKKVRTSDCSSTSSLDSNDSSRATTPGETSSQIGSYSGILAPAFRQSQLPFERVVSGSHPPPSNSIRLSSTRAAGYKPRRSSQLRFSSYGDVHIDKDTLCKLEGVALREASCRVNHQRSSYTPETTADSSSDVADSERPSGTDTDGILSERETKDNRENAAPSTSSKVLELRNFRDKGKENDKSTDAAGTIELQTSSDYFSFPIHSRPRPKLTPFITPDVSPIYASTPLRGMNRLPIDEVDILGESQWPLLCEKVPESPERPIFRPGSLHVNKSIRRVNSGFEVLPAGTFGMPSEFMTELVDGTAAPELAVSGGGNRSLKKLQKRRQRSMASKTSV